MDFTLKKSHTVKEYAVTLLLKRFSSTPISLIRRLSV